MENPSIKKNVAYNMFYQILSLITPFITAPYISRVLGANGIGVCSYTSSIQSYFTLVAALGTVAYGTREIARVRNDKQKYSKLFWEIELLTVFTTAICLIAWAGVIVVNDNYRIYYVVLSMNILAVLFDISWFFGGLEQYKYIVIRNSVFKILCVILMFVLVHKQDDLIIYMAINAAATLLGNISMWSYLPKLLSKVDFRELHIWPHFKETLVYFVPTIATSIYTVLDKTQLGLITHNKSENGYYEQANKIISICKSVAFVAINTVMGSRISYLYAHDEIDEIKQRTEKSLSYILLMGYACMFGLIGIASNFVPLFFGSGYDKVVELLYIFSPIIIIIGISNCLGSLYYTPSGRRAQSAAYLIVGSVVNVIVNLFLIPRFKSCGAAMASILAELTITILYMAFCNRMVTVKMLLQNSWKRIISGLIMLWCVVEIGNLHISSYVALCSQVIFGAVIYFVVLLIMKDNFVWEYVNVFLQRLKKRKV